MGLITLSPQGVSSPWPEIGESGVTSPTNTGHAMTITDADNGDPDDSKSCLWGPFPALPAGAVSATLRASWSYENGSHSSADTENLFQFFYNPTGSGGTGLQQLFAIDNATGSDNGAVEANIPLTQNMANLHVMDIIRSIQTTAGFTARLDAQVSNIRVEVITAESPMVMM